MKYQRSTLLVLCGGIPLVTSGFASWRTDNGKAISCHNVIHYNDIIMNAMASQITALTIVYSTVYSRRISKKTSKLCVTGLCAGNSPVTGEFHAQRPSNAENGSFWWRHHDMAENAARSIEIRNFQNDGGIWPLSSTCSSCRFIEWYDKFLLNLNKDFMFQI